VKIVDLNVLIYVVNPDTPHHARLRGWWEAAIAGDETLGLPWLVLLGFLRITTNRRSFPTPLAPNAAVGKIDTWLSLENVRVVGERENHWTRLKTLVRETGTAGDLTTEMHLAALALGHDAVLVSCDNDFSRFQGLRWENPLV
jgi:toxin-antitoxin system PIN domain toxin